LAARFLFLALGFLNVFKDKDEDADEIKHHVKRHPGGRKRRFFGANTPNGRIAFCVFAVILLVLIKL
jgi:hypothetical protein